MLRSFTLKHNKGTGDWDLTADTGETLKSFTTEAQAIVTGQLERTVKPGTVWIYNEDGTHDEITFSVTHPSKHCDGVGGTSL